MSKKLFECQLRLNHNLQGLLQGPRQKTCGCVSSSYKNIDNLVSQGCSIRRALCERIQEDICFPLINP